MQNATQETARSNNLTESMKIACCKACLLAERMKDCKNCPFNIGLAVKVSTVLSIPTGIN